jgi:thioredoxin 2
MSDSVQMSCPQCGTLNRVAADRPRAAARCGRCRAALFDGRPLEVDDAGLQRQVETSAIPLLLDVWAPWCGPCRMMAPHFETAAERLAEQVRFLKLNADEAPAASARLGVRGIPALFLFKGGRVVDQAAGAMTADQIVDWTRGRLSGG